MTREEAIQELQNCKGLIQQDGQDYLDERDIPLLNTAIDALKALPSADAESDDLIIKGAKGIQDGLYNIKDGKLFKYKAKGGTVRTYPIVLSADAVHGEWIWRTDIPIGDGRTSAGYICSHCGKDYWHGNKLKFCPNCGARMKGGDEE